MFGDEANITAVGHHHLEAVIGSQELKDQYCWEKVLGWKGELEALSEIARSQPHTAYTVFTKGYKSKFIYFLTLSKRRSTTYFSQHYSVKRRPSLVICVSSLLWHPLSALSGWLTVWSSTAVCCFYVNNSIARRFNYHTEHVHGERREFHEGVKKTTSSLENCVHEIENGKYGFHSTLGSAAVS